jgi:hypothetical protein
MSRRASSSSKTPEEAPADRLQATVEELSQKVRVLTDIVDALREDLSWLTRNGIPHQPITVIVHRMPRVAGEGIRGTMELSFDQLPDRDPTIDTLSDDQVRTAVIDEIVERLAVPIGELAQEQLNVLLSIVDHAHRDVLQAIRKPQTIPPEQPAPKKRLTKKKKPTAAAVPSVPQEPPPPPCGLLF